jgi:hypothetical protein
MKGRKSYAFYAILLVCIMSACKKMEDLAVNPISNPLGNDSSVPLSQSYSSNRMAVEIPRGIYAVQEVDMPQDIAILENPSIDGIYLRVRWSTIESSKGIYDWSLIDSEIDRAIKYGKKVQIALMAGAYTPSWVEQKGVPFLDFKIIPHAGEGYAHWTHLPIVWDSKFVQYYIKLIKVFAAHLKADSIKYNAVSLIKFSGINQETAETRLPYQDPTYINGTDTASNCVQIWQANGYTQQKIVDAWDKIAGVFNSQFPDKALGMAIIPDPRGFPSIDEFGNIVLADSCYTTKILVDKSQGCDRAVILFNAITDDPNSADILKYVTAQGGMIAYQEKLNYSPKSDTWVEALIQNGLNYGAEFIELFNETIITYPRGVTRGRALFNTI